jgi:phosphatidylserine decarboxylase
MDQRPGFFSRLITQRYFRLAPQDYHRFHSPVDGKIGLMTYISVNI